VQWVRLSVDVDVDADADGAHVGMSVVGLSFSQHCISSLYLITVSHHCNRAPLSLSTTIECRLSVLSSLYYSPVWLCRPRSVAVDDG
jgi:hypothetical protein